MAYSKCRNGDDCTSRSYCLHGSRAALQGLCNLRLLNPIWPVKSMSGLRGCGWLDTTFARRCYYPTRYKPLCVRRHRSIRMCFVDGSMCGAWPMLPPIKSPNIHADQRFWSYQGGCVIIIHRGLLFVRWFESTYRACGGPGLPCPWQTSHGDCMQEREEAIGLPVD